MAEGLSRRELLKKAGFGGVAFLGGSVLGHTVQHEAQAATDEAYANPGPVAHSTMHEEGDAAYGDIFSPPSDLGPDDLDHQTFPPAPDGLPPGTTGTSRSPSRRG